MERTISVSGEGIINAPADFVELSLYLETIKKEYEDAYQSAGEFADELLKVVVSLGFDKRELKTQSYNISSRYESVRDDHGNYQDVFTGYCVSHSMNLRFDFDEKRLAEVLSAVSQTKAAPRINIRFTVKDQEKYKMELLEQITADARKKAEKLASASKVELAELVNIGYNFANMNFYSNTMYDCANEESAQVMCSRKAYGFTAEDIRISERASFVWLIK